VYYQSRSPWLFLEVTIMKKIKKPLLLSALFVIITGLVIVSCPSEPEPVRRVEDPDLVLKGGTYQYLFDEPIIEDGKEYEVIFTIKDCDEDFIGSRLGGKICYKMDLDSNDEKVLSGWDYAVPPTVSKDVITYRWTFKAGASNKDDVTIENPADTPEDGKQYFSFTAQNGWDNYGSGDNFNIMGGFEIKSIATITNWVSEGTVTLGNDDGTAGKGALIEEDMVKIRALPARSKIVITVSVNVVAGGDTRPGYGVCSVGGWEDSNSLSIAVPAGTPNGQQEFDAEFEIAALLVLQPTGYQIAINPYNGATVTKAELFKPGT
jgi:hypothetical protein